MGVVYGGKKEVWREWILGNFQAYISPWWLLTESGGTWPTADGIRWDPGGQAWPMVPKDGSKDEDIRSAGLCAGGNENLTKALAFGAEPT